MVTVIMVLMVVWCGVTNLGGSLASDGTSQMGIDTVLFISSLREFPESKRDLGCVDVVR